MPKLCETLSESIREMANRGITAEMTSLIYYRLYRFRRLLIETVLHFFF